MAAIGLFVTIIEKLFYAEVMQVLNTGLRGVKQYVGTKMVSSVILLVAAGKKTLNRDLKCFYGSCFFLLLSCVRRFVACLTTE